MKKMYEWIKNLPKTDKKEVILSLALTVLVIALVFC